MDKMSASRTSKSKKTKSKQIRKILVFEEFSNNTRTSENQDTNGSLILLKYTSLYVQRINERQSVS